MKVGPSDSLCKRRFQTSTCCCKGNDMVVSNVCKGLF